MAIDWSLIGITSFLTFLATLSGVGLAFILNKKSNNKSDRERAKRLLNALKLDIEANQNLLGQFVQDLADPSWTVFYDLRLGVWESLVSDLMPLLPPSSFFKHVSKLYYELQHIERKVNKVFDLTHNPHITPKGTQERQTLVTSILQHIPNVLVGNSCKSPQVLINEIEDLIKRLR